MSNPDKIEEGDVVDIYWEYTPAIFTATVLHAPVAIGDSWTVRGCKSGVTLHYIQNFTCMTLVRKADNAT